MTCEDVVESLSNMCLYDVCSLILIEPTYQSNIGIRLRRKIKPLKTHLPYSHFQEVFFSLIAKESPKKNIFL